MYILLKVEASIDFEINPELSFENGVPVDVRKNAPTVEKQLNDSKSILQLVKELIVIRKRYEALCPNGEFEILKAGYPFVFSRGEGDNKIYVAINPSSDSYEYILPDKTVILVSQNVVINGQKLKMDGVSYVILAKKKV